MKILGLLILTLLKDADAYNSTMDPSSVSSTTTTTGATGYEKPITESVTSKASSILRKKTYKTQKDSCEILNRKMVCDQQVKIKKRAEKDDATKDELIDIPESDLE